MKLLSLFFGAMFMLSTNACFADNEVVVAPENLPAKITSYVNANFPKSTVAHATKEREGMGFEYKVWLSEGYTLEFDRGERIKEIKGTTQLPDAVVPQAVRNDVATRYPGTYVVEWELYNRKAIQEVKLNNGVELLYNLQGMFIGIDD